MKVVLTGGGTGGHIYPALSIAAAMLAEDPEVDLLFIGSSHGPEGRLAKESGLRFIGLPSRPFGGAISLSNVAALWKLALAAIRALSVLRAEKPEVAIGTGGYTSAAVMLAQCLRRGPSLIHEQNVEPGRTNLLLSRFVRAVCVTFKESVGFFPARKVTVTGLPVRPEILAPRAKESARAALGLRTDLFTVFVCGGSQGARKINELVLGAVPLLASLNVQILHQTGERNYEEVKTNAPSGIETYKIAPYFDDPSDAYWAADLIVCRSGASTLAELCAVGLPAILVPYPYAYANHQAKNASVLEKRGSAIVMEESSSSAEELANQIAALARDPERLRAMASASAALARPDAATAVIRVAKSLVRSQV
ncbi:MAG: undecaprenyldiphospho-muramoylpentapeptide beta-N-acetylglucosaminyltransferase [Armatimonadota bacterium]|nr:undecaprenyldiphospho-muramoylpentapeptide beta-N-acetylglucosaminyltransferase [Armatimonadota bacterium]